MTDPKEEEGVQIYIWKDGTKHTTPEPNNTPTREDAEAHVLKELGYSRLYVMQVSIGETASKALIDKQYALSIATQLATDVLEEFDETRVPNDISRSGWSEPFRRADVSVQQFFEWKKRLESL
jgi:hypothetical protein